VVRISEANGDPMKAIPGNQLSSKIDNR